jgi:hypothetical protein
MPRTLSTPAVADDDEGVLPTRALAAPAAASLALGVEGKAKAKPADDEPAEVIPQRAPARVAAVTKTKSTKRLEPGDLVCGHCGQGNPPIRKFCSRCGEELKNAEVVKSHWWQRKRKSKTLEAGARPGQPGAGGGKNVGKAALKGFHRMRALALVLVVGMAFLYAFVPGLRENVNGVVGPPIGSAKGWISDKWKGATTATETIPPFSESASASLPKHPAKLAFDDITNTYWAAPWDTNDKPFLDIVYKKAQTLVAVVVHPGAQDGDNVTKFLRPAELRIRYDSGLTDVVPVAADGDVITVNLENATTFRTARITVTKVYEVKGLNNVAISEIELKRKKS